MSNCCPWDDNGRCVSRVGCIAQKYFDQKPEPIKVSREWVVKWMNYLTQYEMLPFYDMLKELGVEVEDA